MPSKVYLIGNAHIDPVWQWRWQEGLSEIKATFKSVLDRMNEFSDFKFTCAGSMYYEWIEASDPIMFAQIKKRIQEGRWCVAGGWYVQPDCNLPSGESFTRQGLIAQNYFLEKFGRIATTGYNVDSFGHTHGLPQILKKSGLQNYVFMRPNKAEKELSENLFLWQGQDGSVIPTYRLSYSYEIADMQRFALWEQEVANEKNASMVFYGVGNHGGGPTIQLLNAISEKIVENDKYVFSTVDEYFADLDIQNISIVNDSLEFHSRGCFSTTAEIKKANRLAENNLITAEIFSTISEILVGTKYPKEKLTQAWKNTLFNQFHDILCGCVVERAVEDALYSYGESINISERIINLALQNISWKIDTLKGFSENVFRDDRFFPFTHEHLGTPVVIFNSLPFNAKLPVKIFLKCMRVEDEAGNNIPFQIVRGQQTDCRLNHYNTLIYTEIPAFGYKVVRIFNKGEILHREGTLSFGEDFIENNYLRVEFDKVDGGIKHLFDKRNKRELLTAKSQALLFDDSANDTWGHRLFAFDKKEAEYTNAEMKIIENGLVCVTMRVTTYCKGFSLRQDYTLYADDDVLYVDGKTSGCGKHKVLRMSFPVSVSKACSIAEVPYGVTEFSIDNGETPCGKWFAVVDKGTNLGVTFLNDGKYSYSVDGTTAYMTILRTAAYCDHFGVRDERCEYMDVGPQKFRYALAPYFNNAKAERQASILNFEPRAVLETFHKGELETEFSGIRVHDKNVLVTAFKKAEDGNGYILRAYEAEGKETRTDIEIGLLNKKFEVEFEPFEVKTYRITENTFQETSLIEQDELEVYTR